MSILNSKYRRTSSKENSSGSRVIRRRLIFNMKRYLKGIGALHLLTLHKQTQEPLLHLAVEEGRLDVVEVLIGRGEDPNVRGLWGTTPLHEAGAAGKTEMIQVLLKYGADVSAETPMGESPLLLAFVAGHQEAVEMLLAAGARFSTEADTVA